MRRRSREADPTGADGGVPVMGPEPRIALAASPREWAQRLHRHVADHGGALVRATVLSPRDALDEDVDVLVIDDTTSFFSPRLVEELHRRGRGVLGVFDPDDPRGKGDLADAGVDDVIERGAPPEAFVTAIAALGSRLPSMPGSVADGRAAPGSAAGGRLVPGSAAGALQAPAHGSTPPGGAAGAALAAPAAHQATAPGRATPGTSAEAAGRMLVVAGAGGGVGATEVAVELARLSGHSGRPTVLADTDDVGPAVAQRLAVPLYPNIRAALDAMQQRDGTVDDVLSPVAAGRFTVLPGLATGRSWADLRPGEVGDLLRGLAGARRTVVATAGPHIEDVPAAAGGRSRHGLARHLLAGADQVVVVAAGTPVGLGRLLEWLADAGAFLDPARTAVVLNRAPDDRFRRAEVRAELARSHVCMPAWFVPADPRVPDAAWRGSLVARGPFTRALEPLGSALLPAAAGRRARRRLRRAGWNRA